MSSNLQSISDLLKNSTNRPDQPQDDNHNPNQNPNPPAPNSQTTPAEQPGETPTTQTANPPKANPPRKARTTRATTTKQGKTPNATGLPGSEQSNPIPPTDVTAALDAENRTETGIHDDLIDGDEDDDDTPQIISVRNNPQDAATEQARRAKLALDKAVKAEDDGNEERADFFYAIYHSLLPPKSQPDRATTQRPSKTIDIDTIDRHPKLIDSSFASSVSQKRPQPDGVTTEVRNLKFKWGVSNTHTEGGFAPFFHKNISELKGYIPLTTFNKEWQARALAWNTENRLKVSGEEKGLRYWGLRVPSEYMMSFSNWTLNYVVFYKTMRFAYMFVTLGEWILLHKANCDKILRKDGFMTALRYDIKVRTNAWQFKPTEDGEEYVSDFSKLKPETYEEAYGEARNNDELQFKTSNPYEIGGPREKWDATSGTRPSKTAQSTPDARLPQQTVPSTSQTRTQVIPTNPALPPKPNQPRNQRPGNGYQGNNFNPNYARGNGRQGGRHRE
ncbi:hypothetical protein MJO28_004172 [Puccinia striiformis f. sp. tritici]|uniref:Uncharacterized protein n=1 Tax=Puccinia striiformis f. sp. tritici TaxID=168172 RepID=A0ACC0ENA5_9BASI|nr:hypothetical protein MJO28_004172 [Puccinia striiformis f. sp. tritici]